MLYEIIKKFSNIENLKLDSIENIENHDLDIVFFATKAQFFNELRTFFVEKRYKSYRFVS
jgi:hypothetical protein